MIKKYIPIIKQALKQLSIKQKAWIERNFHAENENQEHQDWVTEAEWAHINQRPLRARKLLYAIIIAFLLLLIWAALSPLDEIARGDGKVIPSQKLQTIQSLDGGLVQDILVREGQIVDAGDVLVKVDPTRFIASAAESQSQFSSLTAEVARLKSQVNDEKLTFPKGIDDQDLILRQTKLYESSLAELKEQQEAYQNQIEQKQQEYNEASAAVEQYSKTLKLAQRELDFTRPLLDSGAVSDIDILRLEREVVRLSGELNRARATQARSQSAIKETKNKQKEDHLNMINRWRQQLTDSSSKLDALTKASKGLQDKVKQADIRAPVRGTIQRLHVNTVGGVLTPGSTVVDIVPLDDKLIIEARIPPKDIAFIKRGQKATVRFTAYDFAIYGGFIATVTHISADTITDENDNTYYLVRLITEQATLNQDLLIIPGMTAQVDIVTGKRTVLMYLLKPLLRASATALHER